LGDSFVRLVFPSIFSGLDSGTPQIAAPGMALGLAFLTLFELLGFCLGFAALGILLMRSLRLELESDVENLLVAVAVGLITTEILLFLIQITQHIRLGCLATVALLCGILIWEWKSVWERLRGTLRHIVPQSSPHRWLLILVVVVASIEFLSALAPLNGSDALQYHFTVQKQILEQGFYPIFSNSHSFICGQHHLLILLGLALGSEQLAMGFIYLGGVLSAASMACLASRWASPLIVTGFVAIFLLSPIVFWQVTSSGSPDIYMALLVSTAVIVLGQKNSANRWGQALLVGYLVGGIAGAKYTGCFIAAALALAVVVELRTTLGASLFLAGSFASGIWPYLRNFVWTGNPVFPFLSTRLSRELVTTYAIANMYKDTAPSASHNPIDALPFLFFAGIRRSGPGLWEFFGPTVLVLAPLILLAVKNERQWRVSIIVWFASSLAISFSSGLARFLLPIFPLALSCAAAGFEVSWRERWTIVRRITGSLLILTGFACAVGFAMYFQDQLRVAVGLEKKSDYLKDKAPDYQVAFAVNELLGSRKSQQKTLVFLRHLYYLDIPYVNGDPSTSFEVDPERMQSTQDWRTFFEKKNIAYVVRSPVYPPAIAGPLEEMERTGDLTPIAHAEVQNFLDKRVDQSRATIPVVILKVNR
jgi:uncharacterized protein DUF1420